MEEGEQLAGQSYKYLSDSPTRAGTTCLQRDSEARRDHIDVVGSASRWPAYR